MPPERPLAAGAAAADPAPVLPGAALPPAGTDDARWFSEVYQGDTVPQLTVRAVGTGALIGAFLAVANLYMTLKVGLGFGVALTACLLSYFGWNALRGLSGGRVGQLSILENNCMQSTASAAGFSTGSTICVTFAALMILDPEHRQQPLWVISSFTFVTATMGVLMAIPMKRLLINQEQLPFPSGMAAAATLRSLYDGGGAALRKATAMLVALAGGIVVGVLATAEDQFQALGRFFAWMRERAVDVHLPAQLPAQGFGLIAGKPVYAYAFEPGVAVIGAGMLIGMRVALPMLLSALLLYAGIAPWLQAMDASNAGVAGYVPSLPPAGGGAIYIPLRWGLWTGSSILVFSSLTSVALNWRTVLRSVTALRGLRVGQAGGGDTAVQDVEVPASWMLAGLVPLSLALVAIQIVAFGTSWWVGLCAVALSLVLAFVVCRASAETDLIPQGALGKVMQLVFALISPPGSAGVQASLTHNIMAAGLTANSSGAAADLLIDLKSGYLLGGNPRRQFLAQFAGIVVGTLVCVPAWLLLVPDIAALEKYPAPAAQVWVATARALTGGLGGLPVSILYGILAGAAVGVLLPVLELRFPKARPYLPSATGLGMGWVIPFSASLSIAIGSVLAWAWRRGAAANESLYRVPVAAGLIAGDSLLRAGLAMLATVVTLLA